MEARRGLEELLDAYPENRWILAKLAELETFSGRLEQAEEIYSRLTEVAPSLDGHNNLGWIRLVLGQYPAAIASFRQALELRPEDLLARINLALALEGAGRFGEADVHHRILTDHQDGLPPLAAERMLVALSMARLGQTGSAAEVAEQILETAAGDARVVYQAAQVHALGGNRFSALHYIERALRLGLHPIWLNVPSFDSLRTEPELEQLLRKYETPSADR